MYSEDDDMDCEYRPETPEDILKETHSLPFTSRAVYNQTYDHFQKWSKLNGAAPVSEDVLMKYFSELAEKSKPTTLWSCYSMLKATLRSKDDIDINSYSALRDFVKRKNAGYKPVKAKVFTEEEIAKFLHEASDEHWLDVKVVCVFGVSCGYGTRKLIDIGVDHVKQYDDLILVTMPKTETNSKRSFTITGTFFNIVQKYTALRPKNANTNRFFLQYTRGKCTAHHIGRNKFFGIPRRIAKYLKLPEPERYSGLSFRRNSANVICLNAGARNMTGVAEENNDQSSDYSLDYQTGLLNNSSVSYTSQSVSTSNNNNSNKTEHVCTISCGQVKCAMEENEHSVLHAFSLMKPSDYTITEISPAVFASDPTCRWIVGYTHITEPVSRFNADETFEDITRSIPNNVRINQKYVRGNSSNHLAAYVVVYGVNCRCQKQTSDIFTFSVNEIKCEI